MAQFFYGQKAHDAQQTFVERTNDRDKVMYQLNPFKLGNSTTTPPMLSWVPCVRLCKSLFRN